MEISPERARHSLCPVIRKEKPPAGAVTAASTSCFDQTVSKSRPALQHIISLGWELLWALNSAPAPHFLNHTLPRRNRSLRHTELFKRAGNFAIFLLEDFKIKIRSRGTQASRVWSCRVSFEVIF